MNIQRLKDLKDLRKYLDKFLEEKIAKLGIIRQQKVTTQEK